MAFSRKMYTNEDFLVGAAAVKATWGQSARPHHQLSSEMARLSLKRTDSSRVRVGMPVGTILPTGTGQWTRLHQFWQCHLALPTSIQRHSVDAPLLGTRTTVFHKVCSINKRSLVTCSITIQFNDLKTKNMISLHPPARRKYSMKMKNPK